MEKEFLMRMYCETLTLVINWEIIIFVLIGNLLRHFDGNFRIPCIDRWLNHHQRHARNDENPAENK
jgi:hypothetical protein